MLKSQDHRVIIGKHRAHIYLTLLLRLPSVCPGGVQMAVTLMEKLPSIFTLYFHREGVIYQLKALRDKPIKTLATPKQETDMPSPQTTPPQRTPTSTRRYVHLLHYTLVWNSNILNLILATDYTIFNLTKFRAHSN